MHSVAVSRASVRKYSASVLVSSLEMRLVVMGFWMIILLFGSVYTLCSAKVNHIIPLPDTPCPLEESCFTLSEYASQYFTFTSTLIFLPGIHTLKNSTVAGNIFNVTLLGSPSSLFENITNLHISNLAFISCGMSMDNGAIKVRYVQHFELINCILHNNTGHYGGGLSVEESNFSLVDNVFKANSATSGGGLHVQLSNATFTANRFIENRADKLYTGTGGTVFIFNSIVTISMDVFIGNFAYEVGGGVYASESTVIFTENQFIVNSAYDGGTGVSVYSSMVVFNRNNFSENKCLLSSSDGGGIHTSHATIVCTDNIFVKNVAARAGAIYLLASNLTFTGNNTLLNNAIHMGSAGGAILADYYSNFQFFGDILFLNNSARFGGGVCAYYSNLNIYGNSIFSFNSGEYYGGGFYAVESRLRIDGKALIHSNTADYGGGFHVVNTILHFNGNVSLDRNCARYGGGGYAAASTIKFERNNSFTSNLALNGGALYLTSDSSCHFMPSTITYFNHNDAVQRGGAINIQDSNPILYCGITFFTFPIQLSVFFNQNLLWMQEQSSKIIMLWKLAEICMVV